MSLRDLYENLILPADAELHKQAAELAKTAEEEDAAGRIMARGFVDEMQKLAQGPGIGTPPMVGAGMAPPPPAPPNVGPRMGTGEGKKCPPGQHVCPETGKCIPIGTGDGTGPRREPGRPRRRQSR